MAGSEEEKQRKLKDLRAQLDRLGYGEKRKQASDSSFPANDVRRMLRKSKVAKQIPKPTPKQTPPQSPGKVILYRRDLPRTPSPARSVRRVSRVPVPLEDAVVGQETQHPQRGRFFMVPTNVAGIEGADPVSRLFLERLQDRESPLCSKLARTCDPAGLTPNDFIFMDIETTGLGCSPLFLVGVMLWQGNGFEVRQYLARNYAEEAAVIATFRDECAEKNMLVTFNGKSFDFPFIRTRAAANAVPFDVEIAHFDLLHECRRVWRDVLPDCRLQTLEKRVCGRGRHGDIPGAQIPDAYHEYVRTQDAHQIVEILKHNMLDLVTLADLMTRFPGGVT